MLFYKIKLLEAVRTFLWNTITVRNVISCFKDTPGEIYDIRVFLPVPLCDDNGCLHTIRRDL